MKNIDKINIYVGEVGVAYIDKETALKNYEVANKNYQDIDALLAEAKNINNNISPDGEDNVYQKAINAKNNAINIYNQLEAYVNNENNNDVDKKQAVQELINEIDINDNDNNSLNGGGKYTAKANLENIEKLQNEINEIINEITEIKDNFKKIKSTKNTEKEKAEKIFNSVFNQNDQENEEEENANTQNFVERLNEIDIEIKNITNITEAIEESTSYISERFDRIQNDVEPDPEPDSEPTNEYYLYVGQTQLTDSNFNEEVGNGIIHNRYESSFAPERFNYIAPADTFGTYYVVYPQSWGTIHIEVGEIGGINTINDEYTITINNVEYVVKSTGLAETTYSIWFT